MLSQRNNLLLEHQLLSYAEELHSLQTTLAFDDLPALRAKLSLSKNTTRHLRDYLQDKVNLLRFLTKAKYNLSTARDLLRTTLHWRAVSDYPVLVSTTTPQPTLLSGDSTPTSYFSSSLPLQLGNNSPLHETTFPTELAALGRLSPPPTTVQPLDDPRLHRFLNSGLFYFHKKDNLSRPIAWLTLRHYVRHSNSLSDENDNPNSSASTDSLEELKRFVVFVFEIARRLRLEENSSHHQFVICIDLKGAGLSQLDLEVVPAFLNLYRHHYPGCIAAVHVLNYGWMYAGAWALAKRMLSEETRQRISFPTKDEIVRLLGEDSTPVEYGGTDTYVYTGPSTNDVYASYGRLQQTSPLDGQENTLDAKEETDRLTITTLYTNEKGEVAEQSPGPALSSKESPIVTTPLGGSRLRPFTPIAKSLERNKLRVEEEIHEPSKDHDETESTANNSPTDSETVYYSCSELASADCSADEEEVISKKRKIKRTRLGNSSIGGLKPFSCVDVVDVAGNVENSSTTASRVVELETFPESLAVLERSPNASRSNFIIASLSARISEARAKIQGLADEVGEEPSTSHNGNERVGGERNRRRRKRDGLANFARNITRAVLGGESSTGIKKEGIGFPTKRVSYCWGPDDTAMEIVAGEEDNEEKYEEKELTIRESSSPDPSEPRSQAVSSPRYIPFPISSTLITSTMPSSSPSTLSLESLNNHNTIFSSPSAFSTTIRPTTPSRSSRKLGLARFLATALFTLLSLFRSRGLLRCGRHPITELPRCRADSGMADEECGKDAERNSGRLRGRKRNVTWMLLFWPSWLVVLVVKTFWKIGQVRSVEF